MTTSQLYKALNNYKFQMFELLKRISKKLPDSDKYADALVKRIELEAEDL